MKYQKNYALYTMSSGNGQVNSIVQALMHWRSCLFLVRNQRCERTFCGLVTEVSGYNLIKEAAVYPLAMC
jgi:hypothetical protein